MAVGRELFLILAVRFAVIPGIDHQAEAYQQPGKDARDEHRSHGDAGGEAVEDEGDRGRDDDPEAAGGGDERGDKGLVIAEADQQRDRHRADRGYRGGAGTGDRAVKQAGRHDRAGKAAGLVAREVGEHIEKLVGNPAARHDDAGEHEERHGDKRSGVDAADHLPHDEFDLAGKGRVEEVRDHRRYAHGDPDRYGERKTDGEYGEYITKHFIFLL